jgi:hypothetical protein
MFLGNVEESHMMCMTKVDDRGWDEFRIHIVDAVIEPGHQIK